MDSFTILSLKTPGTEVRGRVREIERRAGKEKERKHSMWREERRWREGGERMEWGKRQRLSPAEQVEEVRSEEVAVCHRGAAAVL